MTLATPPAPPLAARKAGTPATARPAPDALDQLVLNEVALGHLTPVRFDVGQCRQIIDAGVLPVDSRVELLGGLLVHKNRADSGGDPMGHGPRHKHLVNCLIALAKRLDERLNHIQIQLPVQITPDYAPEPDGSIVIGSADDFADRIPEAGDVACALEASSSSLRVDRLVKAQVYAAAGIPQYVILDADDREIDVHESPAPGRRRYRKHYTLHPGDTLRLMLGGGRVLDVPASELLPRT